MCNSPGQFSTLLPAFISLVILLSDSSSRGRGGIGKAPEHWQRGGELARRLGGDVRGEPAGPVAGPDALPGFDQNIIESPTSGVRLRTRRICRWRDGKMVLRWAAAAWLMTEKHFSTFEVEF